MIIESRILAAEAEGNEVLQNLQQPHIYGAAEPGFRFCRSHSFRNVSSRSAT